jgi:metal-responsive CopG/Arc/MetJ family transcriptional regulator
MKRKNCINAGVSIEQDLLRELDQRRREISVREGRDLPRSAYICELLKKALEHEKEVS